MSHRGPRRQWNRDQSDRPPPHLQYESSENRLRKAILAFGEQKAFNAQAELEALAGTIRDQSDELLDVAANTIELSVIEQPHKIPYVAALVVLLYVSKDANSTEPDPVGLRVLRSCWRCCRDAMQTNSARQLRAWVQFFSQLTLSGIVPAKALLDFLSSIAQALDELGSSRKRLMKASTCILEGLIQAGPLLEEYDAMTVKRLVDAVISALPPSDRREMTNPFLILPTMDHEESITSESVARLTTALRSLSNSRFVCSLEIHPRPHTALPAFKGEQFALETVLLPPEHDKEPIAGPDVGLEAEVEFPEYFMSLFDDSITPSPESPQGHSLHAVISDIVDIYEVNRRDCARMLTELPRWTTAATFRSKSEPEAQGEQGWELECTLVEEGALLSKLLMLPTASMRLAYFFSLLAELCKLSPNRFGPAVGKSFRKLHNLIGDGLDVEIVRRFGELFALHMSNFGFQWVWKEWLPDLELQPSHPKRAFIKRVLDLETRLAYFDRIARSVPEPFQAPVAEAMPEQAPGSDYSYSDPNTQHFAIAQEILNWLQGRTDPAEVINGFESHRERLIDNGEAESAAVSILRKIVVQALLEIGSRSFSHFLNAVERYIKLMRYISVGSEAKADILEAAGMFWHKNRHMMTITFDKLIQYQFLDPSDLVMWSFRRNGGALDTFGWELVRNALDKANGRVIVAQKKIANEQKMADDDAATAKAREGADMDVDGPNKGENGHSRLASLAATRSASDALVQEQERTLKAALEQFIAYLSTTSFVLREDAWNSRSSWQEAHHAALETWGWYRYFCCSYSSQLVTHSQSLGATFDSCIGMKVGPAETILRRFWLLARGEADN